MPWMPLMNREYFLTFLTLVLFGIVQIESLPATPLFQTEKTDSIGRAIQLLSEKIKIKPDSSFLYCRVGYLYLKLEKWDEAKLSFEKCLSLNDTLAEAYNGLGLAYHGMGKSPIVPIEAIKKLFKIDNYTKAEKQFLHAIRLKPDYLDPQYNLGVNYLSKGGNNNYHKAVEALKKVLARDSKFKDADFVLGTAYLQLKDYTNAEITFKKVIKANRTVGKTMLKLSNVYLYTGKNKEATHFYYEGILRLRDVKTWNDIYAELRDIMKPEERKEFKNLSVESKGKFIYKFWRAKDPTPTTEENESFIEHFQRVQYARQHFPDVIPPYYDDRGKIYVKYGPPDARYVSRLYGNGIKSNESWSYEKSIGKGVTFDFVKKGMSYNEVHDLSEAVPAGVNYNTRIQIMRRLYYERAGFTESYDKFSAFGRINGSTLSDFQGERIIAYKKAPATVYHYKPEEKPLPFIYNIAEFKSPSDNRTKTEVYIGVSGNYLKFIPAQGGVLTTLKYSMVVQDSNYVSVYNRKKQTAARANSPAEVHNRLILYQENFILPKGNFTLGLRLENPQGGSCGIYRHRFKARDFTGNHLMLSDIELVSRIDSAKGKGMFIKRGLKVIPYPYNVIRRKQPIYLYFEIYNLKFNAMGQTNYTVSYEIEMLEYQRSFFSKTFGAIGRIFKKEKKMKISTTYQETGTKSMTPEYFSIVLAKLPTGFAQLTLNVMDNLSHEKASQKIKLRLIE